MASFTQSLRAHSQGECSGAELLEQVTNLLIEGRADPGGLLNALRKHHAEHPLDETLFDSLVSLINTRIAELAEEGEDIDDETRLATLMSEQAAVDANAKAPGDGPEVGRGGVGRGIEASEEEATAVISNSSQSSATPRAERKHAVGSVLKDRFELEELVGQGGMSVVYRAIDKRKLEAKSRVPEVAVKVLEVPAKNESAAFMALQREAQKSQTLYHPNIVRAFDFDRDGNIVFMTMEFLAGQSLSKVIRRLGKNGMEHDRAIELIRQMGAALAHAHAHRIVHADFKPGNVILTDDEQIKVIDFGIARAYRAPEDSVADKTLFDPRALGALTPAYASPEMLENRDPDPKDDVYSLGCVAYELLTGRHPFSKTRATEARDADIRPRKPESINRRQWRALSRALAFDPAKRTPSINAFLDEFMPRKNAKSYWLAGVGVTAVVVTGGAWYLLTDMSSDKSPSVPAPITETAPAKVDPSPALEPEPEATILIERRPGEQFRDCATCPQLVVVPQGQIMIGSPADEPNRMDFEGPRYEVAIAKRFAVGETEVTVAEFRQYAKSGQAGELSGCRAPEQDWAIDTKLSWANPGFEQADNHPVTCVSWNDAQGYVQWLSATSGEKYRLPSEEEWEYIARGGRSGATPWGSRVSAACGQANLADRAAVSLYPGLRAFECDDTFAHTAPARIGASNDFNLHGTIGNVFEWTQDCWSPDYSGVSADGQARETGRCEERVLRGGSFFTAPEEVRFAYRNRFAPDHRSVTFGFRVLRELG